MATWSPSTYLTYADERGRPFADLLARVAADEPRLVVDLGCGPGGLTAGLADRWPAAQVVGVDSSPEMLGRAAEYAGPRVRFELGDLREWTPPAPADVIVANAALQWVPGHRDLLPRLLDQLTPGGWLAFQVPGNFGEPSHRLLRDLARDPRFAAATGGVEQPDSHDPQVYLGGLLADEPTLRVDAWETTYLHVLSGPDPVFRWISGTGARPVLQALSEPLRTEFVTEYSAALRAAYPAQAFGTVLPFRRIFVVAQRAGGPMGTSEGR